MAREGHRVSSKRCSRVRDWELLEGTKENERMRTLLKAKTKLSKEKKIASVA